MAVRYRFAEVDDAEQLGALHTLSWQVAYRGLLADEELDALDPVERADQFRAMLGPETLEERRVTWIVAEDDGQLVGHTFCQVHEGVGWLHVLYLDPDAFGSGAGQALHDMAMRSLHREGLRSARLKVLRGNARAIRFYERNGWEFTGEETVEEIGGVEVHDLEMERPLSVDVLSANRSYWNAQSVDYAAWQRWSDEVDWGILQISDEDAGSIFPEVEGLDVLEIGCGTGYVSWWAMQRGANVAIGLDNSPAQLATAASRAADKGVVFPLILGDGHRLPFADDSFDVAINEYGAAIWCDPRVWIPEAARVLRPGGLIWFLGNSVQFMLCAPEFEEQLAGPQLQRAQQGMHRFEWLDTPNVEYHVSHGEMISILTGAGFAIEALHELYAPPDAPATKYGLADGTWASKWPVEEVWVARLHSQ